MTFLQPSFIREHRTARMEIHVPEFPPRAQARLTRAMLIEFEPRPARGHVIVLHWISNLYHFSNQAVRRTDFMEAFRVVLR